jgi:hypothetical protein
MVIESKINETIRVSKGWVSLSTPLSLLFKASANGAETVIIPDLLTIDNYGLTITFDATNLKGQYFLTITDAVGLLIFEVIIKIKANETIKRKQ